MLLIGGIEGSQAEALDGGEDVVGGLGPSEGSWIGVDGVDVVADNRPTEWCLLRLWNFAREPKAFELRPPLDAHVTLIATSFEARFH